MEEKRTTKELLAQSELRDKKAIAYWLEDPETIHLDYMGESMPFLLTDRAAELLHTIYGMDPFASMGWLSERMLDLFGSLVTSGQGLKEASVLGRLPEILRSEGREALKHFKILMLWGFFYFDRSLTLDDLMVTPRTIIRLAQDVWDSANSHGEDLQLDTPKITEEQLEAAEELEGNG